MPTILDYLRADLDCLPCIKSEVACITVRRAAVGFRVYLDGQPEGVWVDSIEDAAELIEENC